MTTEMTAKVELKPCPHCGSEMERSGGWIVHPDDDCIIGGYEFGDATRTDAENAKAWNQRDLRPDDALREATDRIEAASVAGSFKLDRSFCEMLARAALNERNPT